MKLVIAIIAAGVVSSGIAHAGPLTVEVKPATLTWHVGKPVDVALRVVNSSPTTQTFQAMGCSWQQHWKSNDPAIGWQGSSCKKNAPMRISLEPGKAYDKTLPMIATKDGTHSLQLSFTPYESTATTPSAAIAITVER